MNSKLMNTVLLQLTFLLCHALSSLTPKYCALFSGADNSPDLAYLTVHSAYKQWQGEVDHTWE